MIPSTYPSQLINFLQEDIAIPASFMAIAFKHTEHYPGPLPMVLWQYGLVTLEQLDLIYDWIENS